MTAIVISPNGQSKNIPRFFEPLRTALGLHFKVMHSSGQRDDGLSIPVANKISKAKSLQFQMELQVPD